ncbi:MAG TPA: hypothetical protein VKC17_00185 [Sphingomicrobium sp.]|nr:hypothetical protein [Sphingomicrobium sp.]
MKKLYVTGAVLLMTSTGAYAAAPEAVAKVAASCCAALAACCGISLGCCP